MLQHVGESIWCHDQLIRFGGLPLWHRMTLVRLAGGGMIIHSPTRIDEELADEIRSLGPVIAVIAPSWWHDLYLVNCLHAFPSARLYVAPTLARWRPSLPFTDLLTSSNPSVWGDDLEQVSVQGIGLFLDEIAFYHRASRSLIVADLLFNFSDRDAPLTRFLASIVIGPYPGCRFARMYRPFILDSSRFRASIEHILDWDFKRIIVAHGAVVQDDGKRAFRSAFHWLLR